MEQGACIPGFPNIGLPADHLKLAKFDGPHSASYPELKKVLKMMAKSAPEKNRTTHQPSAVSAR